MMAFESTRARAAQTLASASAAAVMALAPHAFGAETPAPAAASETSEKPPTAPAPQASTPTAPAAQASTPTAPAAQASTPREPAWEQAAALRRGGFSVGLSLGVGLGSIAGYPNDVKKIGFERYYTETGLALGSATELWIAGALADWFNFGLGLGGQSLMPSGQAGSSVTFTFRVETFPLFSLGGRYRDLGVLLLAGTGSATLKQKDGAEETLVDGGGVSRLAVGGFYEGIRFWKFGMGPYASFNYAWSESVREPAVFLGWRSALYTGAVKGP